MRLIITTLALLLLAAPSSAVFQEQPDECDGDCNHVSSNHLETFSPVTVANHYDAEKYPAARTAPTFPNRCASSVSVQTFGGGASFSKPESICLAELVLKMQQAVGDVDGAKATVSGAASSLTWKRRAEKFRTIITLGFY